MVSIINANPRNRTVDVTLTINEIFDILNGLYILEGQKEDEINREYADSKDKEQLTRYKKLRGEIQKVKNQIK